VALMIDLLSKLVDTTAKNIDLGELIVPG